MSYRVKTSCLSRHGYAEHALADAARRSGYRVEADSVVFTDPNELDEFINAIEALKRHSTPASGFESLFDLM
jgi:hypothetical protein